ncbi:MAG: hypothetical protein U0746_07320 [Gemmataceae bacterium]
MNDDNEEANASTATVLAQTYMLVGLIAIVGLGVALLQRGSETWALAPALVGGAGLVFRWRLSVLCVFLSLAYVLIAPSFSGVHFVQPRRIPPLTIDLLLCASTLVYVMANNRMLSLEVTLLPVEPQRPRTAAPTRSIDTAPTGEIFGAIIVAAGATVAAFFLWEATAVLDPPLGIPRRDWRVGQVIWAVSAILVAVVGTLAYLGWRRQSPLEAELYLRDVFWAETRGEQRLLNRWRAFGLRQRERSKRA